MPPYREHASPPPTSSISFPTSCIWTMPSAPGAAIHFRYVFASGSHSSFTTNRWWGRS